MDQIYTCLKNSWPWSILGVAPQRLWLPKVYLLMAFNKYSLWFSQFCLASALGSHSKASPRAFVCCEVQPRSLGQCTPSVEKNKLSLPSTWHFQGHPAHMFCEEGERVCCVILTPPEGTGGDFPFFLGLNPPIKSTPQDLVYSVNFTGSTETLDLYILHHLLLINRMVWVERDLKDHPVSPPLLWAGAPSSRPRCWGACPACPWTIPGMGHPQVLCATCSWASQPTQERTFS